MTDQLLHIEVSHEDIQQAGPGIIGNPIANALGRTTGARWRVWEGRVAQEMCAPYRMVTLPENVQGSVGDTRRFVEVAAFYVSDRIGEREVCGLRGGHYRRSAI